MIPFQKIDPAIGHLAVLAILKSRDQVMKDPQVTFQTYYLSQFYVKKPRKYYFKTYLQVSRHLKSTI